MGKRGPAPKPTALKIKQGNPGKRPLNSNEPNPRAVTNTNPPKGLLLSAEAKSIWKDLAPKLRNFKMLTEADVYSFTRYCNLFAEVFTLQKTLKKLGTSYPVQKIDKSGDTYVSHYKVRPEYSLYIDLMKQLQIMEREFGLTPSSRSGLSVAIEEEEENGLVALLRRKAEREDKNPFLSH